MDPVCSAAVRESFFRLFADRLIYRGDRLVNWDCQLQTAVADDEVYHETVQGHFWHLRYPVIDPRPGEPAHVVVATTRPETMLGDTAVAVHPRDPRAGALVGKSVRLPLVGRLIPIVADEQVVLSDPASEDEKARFSTGFLKVTPAHDPDDYQIGLRHDLEMINVMAPDGTINAEGGTYEGLDRFEARKRVVADLEAQGLVERIEAYTHEVGPSSRSHVPLEPSLSDPW